MTGKTKVVLAVVVYFAGFFAVGSWAAYREKCGPELRVGDGMIPDARPMVEAFVWPVAMPFIALADVRDRMHPEFAKCQPRLDSLRKATP